MEYSWQKDSSYIERKSLQQDQEEELRRGGTQYTHVSGDYSTIVKDNIMFNREPFSPFKTKVKSRKEPDNISELRGYELTVASCIEQLLNDPRQSKPFSVVDIGGVYGLTWHRLANQFHQHVENGALEFIITGLENYESIPPRVTMLEWYFPLLSNEELDFVDRNSHLVDRLICTPKEWAIESPFTNIGLCHERTSATYHSQIPGDELAGMLSSLSPYGVYFSDTGNYINPNSANLSQRVSELQSSQAILKAKLGLEQVHRAEYGPQRGTDFAANILRKKDGPKIIGY